MTPVSDRGILMQYEMERLFQDKVHANSCSLKLAVYSLWAGYLADGHHKVDGVC